MSHPIYVRCENEDSSKCGNRNKKDLYPHRTPDQVTTDQVTMVFTTFKECTEYDRESKRCKAKNPKNMEIIALALRFTVNCAHDQMQEQARFKGSALSELEKTLILQKETIAVKGFEREQGMISMLQDMINGRRVEERENEFQLQRAAEVDRAAAADRTAGGAETLQGGRQKKASKTLPAEGDGDESMGETSGSRRKGRKPVAATMPFGSAMSGAAGPGLSRKRESSQEPGSKSREASQTRVGRTHTVYASDDANELPLMGKKGTRGNKERDSAPTPGKKSKRDR